ncbi:hypothetical protein DFH09DRAFT_1094087 [Mycena vulgaris]|nr:hypothetical protein DFH09DRAFT_1094087 [Mycena vulgaris]
MNWQKEKAKIPRVQGRRAPTGLPSAAIPLSRRRSNGPSYSITQPTPLVLPSLTHTDETRLEARWSKREGGNEAELTPFHEKRARNQGRWRCDDEGPNVGLHTVTVFAGVMGAVYGSPSRAVAKIQIPVCGTGAADPSSARTRLSGSFDGRTRIYWDVQWRCPYARFNSRQAKLCKLNVQFRGGSSKFNTFLSQNEFNGLKTNASGAEPRK